MFYDKDFVSQGLIILACSIVAITLSVVIS